MPCTPLAFTVCQAKREREPHLYHLLLLFAVVEQCFYKVPQLLGTKIISF